jgi:curved DNA-binding protein CbpA
MNLPRSGRVEEHPVALVLGSLSARGFTGILRLEQDGRSWSLSLDGGAVAAAESASPEDQIGRVVIDANLCDSTKVGESLRRMAASPGKKQLDLLVEMGALTPDSADRAARLRLARCAARIFSLPAAAFTVEERAVEQDRGAPLDVPWVIYRGLRLHLDEMRLDRELGRLAGQAIKLKVDPTEVQDRYAFADEERIVLAYLQKGYWELGDLVDACVSLARQIVLSVVYALLSGDHLDAQPSDNVPRLRKRAREQTQRMPSTSPPGFVKKHGTDAPYGGGNTAAGVYKVPTSPPAQPAFVPKPQQPQPTPGTNPRPTVTPGTVPPSGATSQAITAQLREQILAKSRLVDAGADHFKILEVERHASKDQVKAAYFSLAKTYHPDRLALLKLEDLRPQVERIFAKLSEAFSVLSDEPRKQEYLKILAQGGEAVIKRREDDEAAKAVALLSAEEHFRRGEMALRRSLWSQALEEFKKALELNPEEGEHHALLGWASWCASVEKEKVTADVKKSLNKALELNPKCAPAFFYLGQVHKHLGDNERAYAHFQKVLSLQPGHVDAQREVRLIDMRRGKDQQKGGFFDRFKKK